MASALTISSTSSAFLVFAKKHKELHAYFDEGIERWKLESAASGKSTATVEVSAGRGNG
jgi:hypothetical protein